MSEPAIVIRTIEGRQKMPPLESERYERQVALLAAAGIPVPPRGGRVDHTGREAILALLEERG